MPSDHVRHQFYLPRSLSDRLERLAAAPGASKSAILASALSAFLEQQGASELEQRFSHRLNRLSGQLERTERHGETILEVLALFVRYMLTVNAPLAEEDEAARAIGRERFAAFVARVGQQLAAGRPTFGKDGE